MKTKFLQRVLWLMIPLLTILTFGGSQIWAQSTTYTSSGMSNTGWSNGGACQVVINSTSYDGWKLGSNGSSGSIHFDIPTGTTHLHIHFAGWNNDGNGRTLGISTTAGKFVAANNTSTTVSLINDSGVRSSSPFTLATPANASSSYYVDLEMTNVTSSATITIATSSNRAVLWGINAIAAASTYTVTYNGNGNTGGSAPTDATAYNSGATVTVKSNSGNLAKTGWTFAGWNTNATGTGTDRAAGSTFNISANTTLYAKWTCTVTWSVDGATNVYSAQTITYNSAGNKVSSVPTPNPASYCGQVFAGWTTEPYSGNSAPGTLFKTVGDSPNITGDVTFYAVFADYAD